MVYISVAYHILYTMYLQGAYQFKFFYCMSQIVPGTFHFGPTMLNVYLQNELYTHATDLNLDIIQIFTKKRFGVLSSQSPLMVQLIRADSSSELLCLPVVRMSANFSSLESPGQLNQQPSVKEIQICSNEEPNSIFSKKS